MNLICHICANHVNNEEYLCREKMFGLQDEFLYFQCGRCGCLPIAQVPMDLSRYYPPHYYSFGMGPLPTQGLKSWLAARRDRARLTWPKPPWSVAFQVASAPGRRKLGTSAAAEKHAHP